MYKVIAKLQRLVRAENFTFSKDESNKFGGFNYASLSKIISEANDFITKHKLNIAILEKDQDPSKITFLVFNDEKDTVPIEIPVMISLDPGTSSKLNKNQLIGSAITYARKLVYKIIFDTVDDDDKHLDEDRMPQGGPTGVPTIPKIITPNQPLEQEALNATSNPNNITFM